MQGKEGLITGRRRKQSRDLDEWLAEDEARRKRAEAEGRPGRQRRLKEVMTTKVELALGFKPVIPKEIRRIVGNRLPETALMLLWVLPAPFFIWRDRDDPRSDTILEISPVNMWKEERYHELVEDYMRVAADNLPELER